MKSIKEHTMTVANIPVNNQEKQSYAALKNMLLLDTLVTRAIERPDHLPGIVGFSGPSGFGKSTAAAYVAAKHQADYIEVRSLWTKRSFLENLVRLQGQPPRRVAHDLLEQVVQGLARSGRPLIIDEFDNAIDRGLVEIVRDIHEQTKAPIIIIGEEKLPLKLKRWERFDGRVLDWAQAQPADLDDARTLARHYQKGIRIEDDLLEVLAKAAKGSVRRIVTNIERIAYYAKNEGMKSISRNDWGDRQLYSGTDVKVREY